jgi:hypothetical protein
MPDTPSNIQSGVPTAESTVDKGPVVASAEHPKDAHYEPDPDQIVRVSHLVKPDALPLDTPTDYDERGGPEDTTVTDVRVSPAEPSVWEATRDGGGE